MSKFCAKCNVSMEAKFCADCGSKTVDNIRGGCSCGFANGPNYKFCANCGKKAGATSSNSSVVYEETSFRPSAVKQGAVQTSGVQEFQGRLSEVQSEDERLEALKKEEERMNKKLGNFSAPSGALSPRGSPMSPRGMVYGGLQGAYIQPVQYSDPEPVVESPIKSAPLYAPVKQQASQAKPNVEVTEVVIEDTVVPAKVGPNTVCSIDITGDSNSGSDNPKVERRQQHSHILFTPVPGKTHFRFECVLEGSNTLQFTLRTTTGGVLIKNFTLPYNFDLKNVRLVGNTVQLEIL